MQCHDPNPEQLHSLSQDSFGYRASPRLAVVNEVSFDKSASPLWGRPGCAREDLQFLNSQFPPPHTLPPNGQQPDPNETESGDCFVLFVEVALRSDGS